MHLLSFGSSCTFISPRYLSPKFYAIFIVKAFTAPMSKLIGNKQSYPSLPPAVIFFSLPCAPLFKHDFNLVCPGRSCFVWHIHTTSRLHSTEMTSISKKLQRIGHQSLKRDNQSPKKAPTKRTKLQSLWKKASAKRTSWHWLAYFSFSSLLSTPPHLLYFCR